jgi:hypothetical protein
MREFDEFEPLARAVKELVDPASGAVIAIEGHSTSGKSFLTKSLGDRLEIPALETDSFARQLRSADETYLALIDTAGLLGEISRLTNSGSRVMVEGICLRDTLTAIAIAPKLFIYVKRITAAGLWADDPDNELDGNWVDRQSIDYHARERPLERADFVYLRRED